MAVISRRKFRQVRRNPARHNALSLNVETPRPKLKPRREETTFHVKVFEFLGLVLPREAIAFHPANGGKRDKREAAILKAMGVVAGIPDIIIFWDRRAFCLELKASDGELSIEQRGTQAAIQDAGVPVETVRTFEEITARLSEFGIPLRRTVRFGNEWRVAA